MSQFYYFTPCCGEQSFGIINNTQPLTLWPDFTNTIGTVYYVTVGSYSGCVTYSGTSTTQLPELSFYNLIPTFLPYESCTFCTTNIFPCYTPPPFIPPIITGYKNECGVITILPMVVECVVSDPTSFETTDGEVSVSITGGTAPYTVTWTYDDNVIISPSINGLGNGSYTATTVDYWGDYSSTTVCTIFTDKDCTFSGSCVPYYLPVCFEVEMEAISLWSCSTESSGTYNGKPYYELLFDDCTTPSGSFVWWDTDTNRWILSDALGNTTVIDMYNENPGPFPLSDITYSWVYVDGQIVTLSSTLGECPGI
jgi:hypothetical protein